LESRLLLSTFTVTSLADDSGTGELRWAIQQANSAGGTNTINFKAGLTGTITLVQGQLELSAGIPPSPARVQIRSPSAAISLAVCFSLIWVATATLSGLTITKGVSTGAGGEGGGIENSGVLTVSDCTLSGNSTNNDGGGIYSADLLTVLNCSISGNSASQGGGISIGMNDTVGAGTLTVLNCTISDNSASDGRGGGISFAVNATFTLTNSIIRATRTAAFSVMMVVRSKWAIVRSQAIQAPKAALLKMLRVR